MKKTTPASTRSNSTNNAPKAEDAKLATTGKNKALATREQVNLLVMEDEGAGSESVSAKDMAIPRISIIQSGSPQVKKSEGGFIKGAEEGDFFNNIDNAVYAKAEEGFLLIPVSFRRANIEWIPKDDGGGFVADHGSDDAILSKCTKDDKNRMLLPNGHEVVTTAEYFCIVLDEDGSNPRQAVVSMAKTQLKKSRKLNTLLTNLMVPRPNGNGVFNPAFFFSVFHVTSVPESNDKGSWMGWNLVRRGDTLSLEGGADLYLAARQFREAVTAGKVTVAAPVAEAAGGPAADDEKF